MAEEQRCQEGHRLCVNNCGFLGNPATLNLCPKCYRDLRLKNDLSSSASSSSSKLTTIEKSPLSPPTSCSSAAEAVSLPELSAAAARSPTPDVEAVRVPQAANRCAGCRRRVGLTGFNCRCGSTFCGAHRHPEQHACSFDFKSPGREAIARANPVIKAAKLHKI